MKLLLLVILFLISGNFLFAQFNIELGIYPKGRFIYVSRIAYPNPSGSEFLYHFKPGLLLRHKSNALIAKYSHSFGWSAFGDLPTQRSFHLSYRRYFIKELERFKWSKKVKLFAEIENIFQDWRFDKSGVVILEDFEAFNISPFVGFEVYFFKRFKFEVAHGYRFYPKYRNHPDLFFAIMYNLR